MIFIRCGYLMIFICDALARNKQYSFSEDWSAAGEGTSSLLDWSLTPQRHCNGRTSSQILVSCPPVDVRQVSTGDEALRGISEKVLVSNFFVVESVRLSQHNSLSFHCYSPPTRLYSNLPVHVDTTTSSPHVYYYEDVECSACSGSGCYCWTKPLTLSEIFSEKLM